MIIDMGQQERPISSRNGINEDLILFYLFLRRGGNQLAFISTRQGCQVNKKDLIPYDHMMRLGNAK